MHLGKISPLENGIRSFIDNLASIGEQEIIFLHDDCYATVTVAAEQYGIKIPFRPIHIIEYLPDRTKERKDEITKLSVEVAYQRSCASRYTPEKEPMLDELFDLIGVERVARKYDRKDALCCGLPLMFRDMERGQEIQAKNHDDAKGAGAVAMTFLCPVCIRGLGAGTTDTGWTSTCSATSAGWLWGKKYPPTHNSRGYKAVQDDTPCRMAHTITEVWSASVVFPAFIPAASSARPFAGTSPPYTDDSSFATGGKVW